MQRTLLLAALTAGLALYSAHAEFTPPNESQIAAAADIPATLGALLTQASPTEAAAVVQAVLLRLPQDLSPEEQTDRIRAIIRAAFTALPQDQHPALASAIGQSLGSHSVLSLSLPVLSIVQTEIVSIGVAQGTNLGQSFSTAFTAAQGPDVATQQLPLAQPAEQEPHQEPQPLPPEPPVAQLYAGQLL